MDKAKPAPVRLSIGNLDIDLNFDSGPLSEYFAGVYSSFLQPDRAGYPVNVSWTAIWPQTEPIQIKTNIKQKALELTAVGYEGRIEAEGAQLELSTGAPFLGVDYFVRTVTAFLAYQAGGMMFHGAGILRGEKGYIFFGHSGSGKSTVAGFSAEDVVLNDDLLILHPLPDAWMMYATPFWNPTQVKPTNGEGEVHGLYRLVKDTSIFVERMSSGQAVGELAASTPVFPAESDQAQVILERCLQLSQCVPVYRLHFQKNDNFWSVI